MTSSTTPGGSPHGDNPLSEIPLTTLDGTATTWRESAGKATLVVNVASKCGNTPQYEGLQKLYEKYHEQGLEILGFPCNQFGLQEPGRATTIQEFCTLNYGVTFPLMKKTNVNGKNRHPLYAKLTETPDSEGEAGNVQWNFEKFLIAPDGTVTRFRPKTQPDSDEVITAIEAALS
ncbi:MAG: glutathione peroxidase [Cryobacterium sp.]|nr:glutathione peroxidase [Cryobacterium sp.]